ncbi:hypothetical protein L3X38_016651 [Prunus dulcis]|uniref:Retrovirus-related Pol polyprotein from transposon 17.6 n=1 Tax=Prunus dulcis TaxID=3755 RepID=A0AAD4W5N8_PRUDU|nr:hypothetical protein L3X38_016651 [Prunus dulcis]
MDAYSGYNQIFMHPEDQAHTSFITDRGLYCYKVMPFGLKNAGATYQRLVNHLFAPLIGHTMEVYVDDMLVKSRTADQHIPNLSAMFTILKQYKMRLNPTKCAFGVGFRQISWLHDQPKGACCCPDLDLSPRPLTAAPHSSRPSRALSETSPWTAESSAVSSVLIRSKDNAEHPVHYVSKALQDAEVRYPDIEKLAFCPATQLITEPNPSPSQDQTPTENTLDLTQPLWTLFVDGSSNAQGCGAGLVLVSPDKVALEYALRFNFQASNNEAEYEALLAGLRLAKEMDARQIQIFSDSQLVVHQVNQDFTAKDASMTAYLQHARHLLATFHAHSIK